MLAAEREFLVIECGGVCGLRQVPPVRRSPYTAASPSEPTRLPSQAHLAVFPPVLSFLKLTVHSSAGDAIDYSYAVADVRWSYSAELRDTGTYGFVLPPHLIRPTGEEVSAGLRYLATFIFDTEIDL